MPYTYEVVVHESPSISVILFRMQPALTEAVTSPRNMSFLFQVSMYWRIIYGVLRLILGVAFLRLIGQSLADLVYVLMAHELTGTTGDAVLEKIYVLFATHEFTVTYFIAAYFIFWGVIDIIISLCLLTHIRVAFPIAMGLIVLFICYGIFRLTHTHSLVLFGVIIIDIGILYLINYEYKKLTPNTRSV